MMMMTVAVMYSSDQIKLSLQYNIGFILYIYSPIELIVTFAMIRNHKLVTDYMYNSLVTLI